MFVVLINVWRRGELCQISFNNNQSENGAQRVGRGATVNEVFWGDSSQKYFNIKSNV